MNVNQEFKKFQSGLKKLGDPKRAVKEKQYLRSIFRFYGISTHERDAMTKRFVQTHKDLDKKELWRLVDKLWRDDWHDTRALAIDLLHYYSRFLDYSDLPPLGLAWGTVAAYAVSLISAYLTLKLVLKRVR